MRPVNLLILLVSSLFFLGCQQRYFMFERPDFKLENAKPNPIRKYLEPGFPMYKFYFCETVESGEGINFGSYNPCDSFKTAEDRASIERVASLIFIDDERVIYTAADADWDTIPDEIKLDQTRNWVRERKKNLKKTYSYFRGYYQLNRNSLVITLDQGAVVQAGKASRLDKYRKDWEEGKPASKKWKKTFSKARFNMTWLNFEIAEDGNSIILTSVEYHDNNVGIRLDKPVEKNMKDIFGSDIRFRHEPALQQPLSLTVGGLPVGQIGRAGNDKIYYKTDGTILLNEPIGSRKDILTW